jgi:hypothetical protein
MLQIKSLFRCLLLGTFMLAISACGGGGGEGDGKTPGGVSSSSASTTSTSSASTSSASSSAAAATYTIGGSVTGLSSTGLVLVVNGANITVASGASSFSAAGTFTSGTAYSVTQGTKPATQTCTVASGTGTVANANVTNIAVNCVTDTFTVAATVSGLSGTGLMLQLNGGAGLSYGSNVSQTFTNKIDSATAYAVTVQTQPTTPNQQCTVTNGSGSNISADVTNVTVVCVNVPTLSGVVAVGAPLVGMVFVKDSSTPVAIVRTTTIGSNGAYSVDVSGMTPPFVLRAEGTANGHTYTVHSAAVAADLGGTINITQLTNLIVDNVAGQLADAYYQGGNFSSLTPAALSAEVAILKARLLPVLTALGVDASIDLLRSPFTPLVSALDNALDVLVVTINSSTNVATITNIVTQQQIQDTITVPASAESNPPTLDNTSNLASAATDSIAIKAALANFTAMFATTLPSVTSIQAAVTTDFQDNDTDRSMFVASMASASDFLGKQFTDVNIKYIDYADPTQVTALVDFSLRDQNGIEIARKLNYHMRKGVDGIWRLHGNQRVLETEGHVHLYRNSNGCAISGIEFRIQDDNPANNGDAIDHIMVYGPGLPVNGLRFVPPTPGSDQPWVYSNVPNQLNSSYYRMADSCGTSPVSDAVIAAIPDGAAYGFIPYSSVDNSVRANFPAAGANAGRYWTNIQKRPLTLAEVIASTQFPTITTPDLTTFASYVSGSLLISGSGFVSNTFTDFILEQNTASGNFRSADDTEQVASNSGTASTTLSLAASAANDAITSRSVRIATKDVYRRTFMSGHDINVPTFGVSGTVSGLTGTLGLSVSLANGVAPLSITLNAGTTAFALTNPLPTGAPFRVNVATQPAGQSCIVTRGAGVMASTAVTGITVTCAARTPSPLVGTYLTAVGGSSLTLYADGTYAQIQPDIDCRGVEYGIYNWNSTTGDFRSLIAPLDSNADCGLRDATTPSANRTYALTKTANDIRLVSTDGDTTDVTVPAVSSVGNTLVGSFALATFNGAVLTFLNDGTYLLVSTQDRPTGAANNGASSGYERGCYTSTSSTFTVDFSASCLPDGSAAIDTNGTEGLSVNGQSRTFNYIATGTALLINSPLVLFGTRIVVN